MTPNDPVHPEGQPPAALADLDTETALISSMILEATVIPEVRRIVRDDAAFVDRWHRAAYLAICALSDASEIIDPFSLSDRLVLNGAPVADAKNYASNMMDQVPTGINAPYYARRVRECYDRRTLRQLGRDIAALAEDRAWTVPALAQEAVTRLLPVSADTSRAGFVRVADLVFSTLEGIEARGQGRGPVGVRTGYRELDERTLGFLEGELVFVVGVPGSGKTALVLNWLTNMAVDDGVPCGFVSAEMSREAVVSRCVQHIGGVEGVRIRRGVLSTEEWARLAWAGSLLAKSPLWIDDTPAPLLADVLAKCRLLKAQHPALRVIAVDFMQLLQLAHEAGSDNEAILLKRASYALAALARELAVTLLVTAQPNDKQIEAREDKRPQLRDLQGSSGMRQSAHHIALIYREKQYNPAASLDTLEVTWGKNRELETFRAYLEWQGATMKVTSMGRAALDAARLERHPMQRRLALVPGEARGA